MFLTDLSYYHRRASKLAREESKLGLTELLELRLLLARCSPGSDGFSPVDLANILRTSVRETTPESLPERRAPAIADAGTAAAVTGDGGATLVAALVKPCGAIRGVAGAEGEGDADSTTHIRCDLVATSLATVCARVEYGLT